MLYMYCSLVLMKCYGSLAAKECHKSQSQLHVLANANLSSGCKHLYIEQNV